MVVSFTSNANWRFLFQQIMLDLNLINLQLMNFTEEIIFHFPLIDDENVTENELSKFFTNKNAICE